MPVLSRDEIARIKKVRHRARTDLFYLSRYILGYDKVDKEVHGGLIASCQSFAECQGRDVVNADGWCGYTPLQQDPLFLPGPRRRLILDARGHYKTTIQTIAHSVQWILNFPDVWILLVHASLPQVTEKYSELRDHFRYNKNLRYYFREFCPSRRFDAFGNDEEFTVPCRQRISGTPTVSTASIEKVKQGSHYHVIKFFDIVGEENSTPLLLPKTTKKFGLFRNLLVSPKYWMDVEGTRYDFSDTYGQILDNHMKEKKARAELIAKGCTVPPLAEHQQWHFYVRGCYVKDLKGAAPTYQPEELDAPDLLDEKGRPIPVFPAINSVEDLAAMLKDPTYGPSLFAAQMRNNPVDTGEDMPFPLKHLQWVPADRIARVKGPTEITVDTAHTIGSESNDTVLTAAKWDRMSRCYVRDIVVGKMLPNEIVDTLFAMILRYKVDVVKVEETSFVLGLKPSIDRRSQELGVYPLFVWLKRDTQVSKKDRIMGLQPWYKAGRIRFNDDLPEHVKERLRHELSRFPKYSKDDVLDTLADQFQGREWFGVEGEDEDLSKEEQAAVQRQKEEKWTDRRRHDWIFGEGEYAEEGAGLGEDASGL